MDVDAISDSGADDRQQEKAAALQDAAGVTRLVNVVCREDPIWSLELLQRAAATVEELRLNFPDEAHLLAVHAMPRLRRLEVTGNAYACVPELPAPLPGAGVLQWLRVDGLPRATTQTLLRALGRSLEVLQMGVGTAGDGEWPFSCDDLPSLLEQCGLRALRRLVLGRIVGCTHAAAPCDRQRADARRVLPGAEVLCNWCDSVAGEVV
ncbi:uncharacterized protein LOC127751586 [Frankliniella occidentalis]|uniref:Uncharacterized protein LOC127751586 n=1 Tax=Frankliniella occidentalis TaxID=133901 RepID=A0A9C6X8X9_FRAOC|nr:uncharacterized protein LOC127751586 [Frankliniella occidentalis]